MLSLFRSIVVVLDAGPSSDRCGLPAAKLLQWLPRWDAWLKDQLEINDGGNLHLLYGRALTILGLSVEKCQPELEELGQLGSELGLTVAVNLSVVEGLRGIEHVVATLQRARVSTVYLDAREAPENADRDAVQMLVRNLRESGASPLLLGPVSRWMSWGLLDADFINSGNFQMVPAGRSFLLSLRRSGVDPFELRSSFDPCKERFAVFVTSDGALYPCQGLLGIEQFRIGSLDDNVPLRISGFHSDSIAKWASRGPGCVGRVEPDPESPLSPICELHRAMIHRGEGSAYHQGTGRAACRSANSGPPSS